MWLTVRNVQVCAASDLCILPSRGTKKRVQSEAMNIKPNHKRPALIVTAATVASAALFAGATAGQSPSTVISLALILIVAVPGFAAILAFNWTADR